MSKAMAYYQERDAKIVSLRNQGMMLKDIANAIGCTLDVVKNTCRKCGITVEQKRIEEQEAIDTVNRAGYDYVGGFAGAESRVSARCRVCGDVFAKEYRCFRGLAIGSYKWDGQCPHCKKRQADAEKQQRVENREWEQEQRKQRQALRQSRRVNAEVMNLLCAHVCKNCGKLFNARLTGYKSDTFCSGVCAKRYGNRVKRDKRLFLMNERDHDADITLERLYERDEGLCYICGRLCRWNDIADRDGTLIAGETYPSIDHVRPLAKGGTHTWGNVRLACRHCNTLKGAATSPL